MNQRKWKKIIGIFLILGVLVLTFWYGGNAPGLQGFSVSDKAAQSSVENSDVSIQGDKTPDGGNSNKTPDNASGKSDADGMSKNVVGSSSDNNGSGNEGDAEKTVGDKKTDFFGQIIMKVKKIGSSRSKKKNLQVNKKAQSNANKAVDKSKKSKKKKSTATNSGNNSNKNNSDSISNNSSDSNSKSSNNKDNRNTNNDSDNNAGNGDDNTASRKDLTDQTDKSNPQNVTDITQSSDNPAEDAKENDREDKESNDNDDTESITCNIYISCASVLDHMDKLSDSTKKVIPENGVILDLTTVKVKQGATVFDVLQKAARENKVHLEYNYTPAYKTYYIEGIGNLYQFDAGNLSGWMYSVNGEFPGVGCSGYKVNDGDSINWLYTCSFGKDVGGYVADE